MCPFLAQKGSIEHFNKSCIQMFKQKKIYVHTTYAILAPNTVGAASQWWWHKRAIDGTRQANDGELLVNDGEMPVNDGEMSVWSYMYSFHHHWQAFHHH